MRERTPLRKPLLDRLPNLKLITTSGMWNASVDLEACEARGIIVSGTPSERRRNVASHLGADLRAGAADHDRRSRHSRRPAGKRVWAKIFRARHSDCSDSGVSAQKSPAVGPALGMDVIAWSPNMTAERAEACGAKLVTREELLTRSDFLSIHVVLGPRSRGMIGAAEIAHMKPSAYLVNTSRGPIVDEKALIDALETKRIAGAGLDVFDVEPLPPRSSAAAVAEHRADAAHRLRFQGKLRALLCADARRR